MRKRNNWPSFLRLWFGVSGPLVLNFPPKIVRNTHTNSQTGRHTHTHTHSWHSAEWVTCFFFFFFTLYAIIWLNDSSQGRSERAKKSDLRTEAVILRQATLHKACLTSSLISLFYTSLTPLSLNRSLSPLICSLSPPSPLIWSSLAPSQDQQAGNTSESCDRGAKNTAGVVFASIGTSPANSIKAWIYSFSSAS